MLDTSDEFKFEFEKVICTDLLKRYHKNKLTVHELMFEKLGFIWQGMKGKIYQTKKNLFERFKLANFERQRKMIQQASNFN
jgi:hypothetical protein